MENEDEPLVQVFDLLNDISARIDNGDATPDEIEYHMSFYSQWFDTLKYWIDNPSIKLTDQENEDVFGLWYEAMISGLLIQY